MLTELAFCCKSSKKFQSILDITIDLLTSEDRYFPWITTSPHCVYNPDHIWDCAYTCRVTVVRHRSPNLRPECRIIATWQFNALIVLSTYYVSSNCIYFQSHLCAGTNSIAINLITMKDYLFSQHRPPAIPHFFLLAVVIAGDCAMILAFHMLQKICRMKYHNNSFPHLHVI